MTKSTTRRLPAFYRSAEWRDLRSQVIERDGGICQYCGSTKGIQADHVIPRRHGGPDTLDNLVCCCSGCNRVAGNRRFKTFEKKRKWIRQTRCIDPLPGAIPGELPADTKKRLAKERKAQKIRDGWKKKGYNFKPLISQNGGGEMVVKLISRNDD